MPLTKQNVEAEATAISAAITAQATYVADAKSDLAARITALASEEVLLQSLKDALQAIDRSILVWNTNYEGLTDQ